MQATLLTQVLLPAVLTQPTCGLAPHWMVIPVEQLSAVY